MNIEEKNQAAAIRKAGKVLGHFHACGSDRGTPGGDHIDWKPIVKALKAVKYKGDVVIESFTPSRQAGPALFLCARMTANPIVCIRELSKIYRQGDINVVALNEISLDI